MVKQITVILMMLAPAGLPAATLHVEPDGSGEYPTIASALAAATAGDWVELACGTYYEHGLSVPDGVSIRGETGQASCAIIDAQELGRVLEGGDDVAMIGLTIRNGAPSYSSNGGGAYLDHRAYLANCSIVDNRAGPIDDHCDHGSGLDTGTDASLSHCLFSGNSCGPAALLAGSATLSGCRFESHPSHFSALDTGWAPGSELTLNRCIFEGGRLVLSARYLNIYDSVFDGVDLEYFQVLIARLSGSTFHQSDWGGYPSDSGDIWFMSRNIFSNSSMVGHGEPPEAVLMDCNDIFGGWVPPNMSDQIGQNGNFAADPLFCDPEVHVFALHEGSPCTPDLSPCGRLVGAFPVGCGTTGTESRSWSSIKTLY
jgi:hypothetical protein